jgi:lysophospholipase L1-like esterase
MRILVFGDSIAQGYYDTESGGWANLLFKDYLKQNIHSTSELTEFYNVSVSGNNTKQLTSRLDNEITARKWGDDPIILIFAIGINDTFLENGIAVSRPDNYKKDIEKLYEIASKYTDKMIFVGLTSVDEKESDPWVFNTGNSELSWMNNRIQAFDTKLKEFTNENHITFVEIFNDFMKQQQAEQLLADGLHPNSKGHQFIYERVKSALDDVE